MALLTVALVLTDGEEGSYLWVDVPMHLDVTAHHTIQDGILSL